MYANLVIGVDGRASGRDAAALAVLLAADNARTALAHVRRIDSVPGRGGNWDFDLAEAALAAELLETERRALRQTAELLRVDANTVGAGLRRAAIEIAADVIVIGSGHRDVIGRVLLGDDAGSVLDRAPCAVALAPAGYAAAPPHAVETVGVAYDAGEPSQVALAHALALAAGCGAKVVARHVVAPAGDGIGWSGPDTYLADAEERLRAARRRLPDAAGVEIEVVAASVETGLLSFSHDVDVLVCGSSPTPSAAAIHLGAASRYLAHHSHCPLLVPPAIDPAMVSRWAPAKIAAG